MRFASRPPAPGVIRRPAPARRIRYHPFPSYTPADWTPVVEGNTRRHRRLAEPSPFIGRANPEAKRRAQIRIEKAVGNNLWRALNKETLAMLNKARENPNFWRSLIDDFPLAQKYDEAIRRSYRQAYFLIRPHFNLAPSPGDNFMRQADQYLRIYGAAKVRRASIGMKRAITAALLKAIKQGAGERARAAAIMRKIPNSRIMPYYRAARIARTEAHDANTLAADHIARTEHDVKKKVWIASLSERTRPTHATANGQERLLNNPFAVGGYAIERPGDLRAPAKERINCRCVLIYE